MATRIPLVLVDGVIERLGSGDSVLGSLPNPAGLADGCMLAVQNGQWVIVWPSATPCANSLRTADGDLFWASNGQFCLPATSVCESALFTADDEMFLAADGSYCLQHTAQFFTSDGFTFNASDGQFFIAS